MSTSYVQNLQSYLVLYFIAILGYIFAIVFDFYDVTSALDVFRVLRLLCYPGFFFREIARSSYTLDTWAPLLITFLTELSTFILIFAYIFSFKSKNKFKKFLKASNSIIYVSFISYGAQILNSLADDDNHLYIAAIMMFVQTLFLRPFHIYGQLRISNFNSNQLSMEMSSNSSGTTNPEDEPNTDPETQEPEKPVEPFNGGRDTDGWEMFHAIFNTQNLCFIIGMCWSGTKWSIPLYIDTIVNRTENTLPCTILFFCGTVFRRLKFSGVKWLRVVGNLIMHHIVMPLIALIWCLATGVNGNTATICVLMFTLPLDSIGVENHAFDEYKDDSVSTTFFLSHIIGFPLFMAWLAVINETKIFN